MYLTKRRERLQQGRRIALNVNLSPEIHRELEFICNGNKSAAIEFLVREHLLRRRTESAPTP
jgi:hypothetical protein